MNNSKKIESKSKLLWGKDLHKEKSTPVHCVQIESVFKEEWEDSLKGDLLEIGCGSGSDLEIFSKLKNIKTINAIDLGENIEKLAEKYDQREDIDIKRGNALSLEFENDRFDVIYSFGVFHHTSDPVKCISEAYRVLKKNGTIFLYLYSCHEDYLLKRIGVLLEGIIMKFFNYIPYSLQNLICIMLSPLCWIIFSVPSNILNFLGFDTLAKKIPFYFGRHPFSIIEDLKDRLMSPINHRFSKIEMEKLLESIKFSSFEVVNTSTGLYTFAKK